MQRQHSNSNDAHIRMKLGAGHLPVTVSPLRRSLYQFISVPFYPKSDTQTNQEERSHLRTEMKSVTFASNTLTVQFLACQSWGRGFESLRPLQFLKSGFTKAADRRPFVFQDILSFDFS